MQNEPGEVGTGQCETCPCTAPCGGSRLGSECPSAAPCAPEAVTKDPAAIRSCWDWHRAAGTADCLTNTIPAATPNLLLLEHKNKPLMGLGSQGYGFGMRLMDSECGCECKPPEKGFPSRNTVLYSCHPN